MKRLMALALLLAFMLSLAACASKSDETTDTLESGNIDTTIPVMQNVVREIGRERLHTGVELSTDDAEAIVEIIDNGTWIEATPNCAMNCSINLSGTNGRLYYYCSDSGILEELDVSKISYFSALVQEMNNKSLELSDTQKDVLNAILEKYISLDSDTAPIETQKLTLDDVVLLAQKGDALTWSDFEPYQGQEIGSGLYIMRYRINELFEVWVGGVPDETPMYIYLRVNNKADDRIDIRTEDVPAFIVAHYDDLPKDWEAAPDGGGEPAPEEPDFSDSVEIFDVLDRLNYQTYTCDGLPEYLLTATDGTVYSINISEKWVWRGNSEQAELSAELISQLKESGMLIAEEGPLETP